MKKLMPMILAAVLLACVSAPALAQSEKPRVILYTAYRQVGWGDLVQIGWVDEEGGLWKIEGHDLELKWPYGWEEQAAFLEKNPGEKIGEMDFEALFDLKGLIATAENTEGRASGYMNDAGTETSRAVRYDGEGKMETVLLGMTGDDFFINPDMNAQALYRKLRMMFPFVRCYADESWGSLAVPLPTFLKKEGVSVSGARVEIRYDDCEAGPIQTEVTPEEAAQALALWQYGWVTEKENASVVTGGTYTISFMDDAGGTLCSFTLYRGLLATMDGMYRLEIRDADPT